MGATFLGKKRYVTLEWPPYVGDLYIQGRSVPYARTQVLPHRFDNLKKKKKSIITIKKIIG